MTDDRRADPRLLMHTQVEISGIDKAGRQFAERSSLEDVGDAGCRFWLRNSVQAGTAVGVQPLGPGGEKFQGECSRLFLVIWVKWRGDRWMVGTRCLSEEELSGVGLPASDSSPKILAP
jgi:hypothetical protein